MGKLAGVKPEQSATGSIRKEVAIVMVKAEDSCVEQPREADITTRKSAVVPSSSTPSPLEVRDFARADTVPTNKRSGLLRGRESSHPASSGEDVERENPSLTTPGGSAGPQRNVEVKRRENAAVPSSRTPPPPEVRDFARAEAVTMKRCIGSSSWRQNSPSTSPAKRVEEKKLSIAELRGREESHGEDEIIKKETKAEGENNTSRSLKQLASPEGDHNDELLRFVDGVVDVAQIKEGVEKMLAETDWTIEP